MLYEAITYKDIDEFNGDANRRYELQRAAETDYGPAWHWKVLHLKVNRRGAVFVLLCRDTYHV